MKTFFGGTFIENSKLKNEGINHPIKLEYYKTINEDEITKQKKAKYGIQVIKTEYEDEKVNITEKEIRYLTNDEMLLERILNVFKNNEVTPIAVEDLIKEISLI